MIAALVRAEYRKLSSTRLWWALLVPVVVLSALVNLFSGVFTLALGGVDGAGLPLLAASLAYTLGVTAIVAALYGAVVTSGEFRHRTITTTYLTAPVRGPVLAAQMVVCAAVGAAYALVAVLVGVLASLLTRGGDRFPPADALLLVIGIGVLVAALWAALGAALGVLVDHQVGAVLGLLGWTLVVEPLVAALLAAAPALAPLTAYLPVNAGETALYTVPAQLLGGPELVGAAAGVSGALPWPAALAVLAGWTLAAAGAATAAAGRDIT